ncbi:MAG: molecular chaperone HtpG [Thermodesulfovibrionales bacterium]|nr:molecular chaperone HtpG [Thermodesulfovibrionales bacterium]
MTETTTNQIQSHQFKTEVNELLNLMIHSLYSHKEVFLRELLSNASDAIDRARYLALTDDSIYENDPEWKIKIIVDTENKTLTIRDNGIGMTKEEIIEALGTIAHSGTKEFIKKLQSSDSKASAELIGQFGVGFYSSFMVADRVVVLSRRAGLPNNKAVKWESKGQGSFTVEDTTKETRGTDVVVYLKDDEKKYLEEWEIKKIVKQYSDFIEHPIILDIEREKPSELEKGKTVKLREEEKINSQKAIWLKDKSEIKDEEYEEFYKHISHDYQGPLKVIHYKAEGTQEFTALLFIPKSAPFNILYRDYKIGPMLYVKRVQIMKNCDALLPEWLRFVKGVIDSSDLPLNVSREMLQNNRQVEIIKKSITKKVLETLSEMKKNEKDNYVRFYKEFGRVLKEGIHFDFSKHEQIGELLLFESLKFNNNNFTTLDNYIELMKPEQEYIYYITASTVAEALDSPYVEAFKDKDYDVLVFTDEIDDIIFSGYEYKGKKLKAVMKGDIDLDKSSSVKQQVDKFGKLIDFMKDALKDYVKDVRLSGRLKDSPCCLVYDESAIDSRVEKLMKAMGQDIPENKKILEINPSHPLYESMNNLFEKEGSSEQIRDYVSMLYDHALILDGSKPKNPNAMLKGLSELMMHKINSQLQS